MTKNRYALRDEATADRNIARELYDNENPELLDIWKAITSLTDKFESELDDLLDEIAIDGIAAPTSADDPEKYEERSNRALENIRRALKEIVLKENILGEEPSFGEGIEFSPIHNMHYDTRLEG